MNSEPEWIADNLKALTFFFSHNSYLLSDDPDTKPIDKIFQLVTEYKAHTYVDNWQTHIQYYGPLKDNQEHGLGILYNTA